MRRPSLLAVRSSLLLLQQFPSRHALWRICSPLFSTYPYPFCVPFLTTWITLRLGPVSVEYVKSEVNQARQRKKLDKKMRNAKSMPLRLSCCPRVSQTDAKTLSSDEETMSLGGRGGGNVTRTQPTSLQILKECPANSQMIFECIIGRSVRWSSPVTPAPRISQKDKCTIFVYRQFAAVSGTEELSYWRQSRNSDLLIRKSKYLWMVGDVILASFYKILPLFLTPFFSCGFETGRGSDIQ